MTTLCNTNESHWHYQTKLLFVIVNHCQHIDETQTVKITRKITPFDERNYNVMEL